MATLVTTEAITQEDAERYIREGWVSITLLDGADLFDRYTFAACLRWLRQSDVPGEFDYQDATPSLGSGATRYWLSDPRVGFELKMRFG